MGSVNKVILVGNLGRDAELRYTPGGAAVATLNLATTEVFKDREGQKKEDTQWHRVILWGKTAETLQDYLTKGKQIYVEGRLQTRNWEKDGQKHYTTEIKADRTFANFPLVRMSRLSVMPVTDDEWARIEKMSTGSASGKG